MAKTISTILGVVFLIMGVLGFSSPEMMSMHLSAALNVVYILTGLIALYFGWKGTLQSARVFCYVLGIIYGLLGLIGLLAGGPGQLMTLIPGQIMFGTADHVMHLIMGGIFLLAGFATRPAVRPADRI